VLGGAGPAIAAVPLTVVWVGGSFVTLLTGISLGKVGPVDAAQRVGYVFFMSVAQVIQPPCLFHTPLSPCSFSRLRSLLYFSTAISTSGSWWIALSLARND